MEKSLSAVNRTPCRYIFTHLRRNTAETLKVKDPSSNQHSALYLYCFTYKNESYFNFFDSSTPPFNLFKFIHTHPSLYLLSCGSHSWAQKPFHQFLLQHDGIHSKPLRHWQTKIATGLRKLRLQASRKGKKKQSLFSWFLSWNMFLLHSLVFRFFSSQPYFFV